MSVPVVEILRTGTVVRIILNRPDKRNALTRAMLADLWQGLRTLPAETRLVVLAANGPVFCAGMDLQEMQGTAQWGNSAEVWQQDADLYRQVVEALFVLPCPTLCVVQGPVVAGGVGLVLACDMVLATETASFALPEPKRGITASLVSPLLVYRAGAGAASWLLLSGQAMSATSAERSGLVHALVGNATLDGDVSKYVESILSGAPEALRATKQQLLADITGPMHSAWDRASQLSAASRGQPEAREGLQAFLEKRLPNWVSSAGEAANNPQ